jgi:hypothetical protein
MSEIPVFSELIHRFLDGETSDVEQGLLFTELAKDPQLQTELQQSLTIRDATLTESRNTVIPAALTERVFRGALTPAANSEVAAAVRTTAAASMLRRFLVVLGSAISGAGLMYLLSTPSTDAMRSAKPDIASNATTMKATALPGNKSTVALNGVDHVFRSSSEEANRSNESSDRSQSNIEHSRSNQKSVRIETEKVGPRVNAQTQNVSKAKDVAASSSDPSERASDNASQLTKDEGASHSEAITPTLPRSSSSPSLAIAAIGFDISPVLLADENASISKQRIHLRALAYATLLQRHGLRASTMLYENIALGYDYALRPGHFLGVTGGIEYFPLFVEENQIVSPQLSLLWAGISYAFEPDLFGAGWIRPSAACAVGALSSGPLAKGLLGIRVEPITGISTALHVEFTEVLLRNAGNWYGTQKYNLSYGISAMF